MSAADRARLRRNRRRSNRIVVAVEIDADDMPAALVTFRVLGADKVRDKAAIGLALGELCKKILNLPILQRDNNN